MSQEYIYAFKEFHKKDGTVNRVERPILKENWDMISPQGKAESGWKEIIYNKPQPARTAFPELEQAKQQIEQKKVEMQMTRKEMVQLLKFKGVEFDAEMENHELLALLRKPVVAKPYVPEGIEEAAPTATDEIQVPYHSVDTTSSGFVNGTTTNYKDMNRFELMRVLREKKILTFSNRSTKEELIAMLP